MTYKIDRLFGSKTRVAMLTKLLSNPEKKYYLRELSSELDLPYSMIHKEKENLLKLDILTEEKKGKINLVAINRSLPYFDELRSLIAKTSGIGGATREAVEGLEGVRYAAVFGSVASGTQGAESDLDLLVVGELREEELLKAVTALERGIGREVNYILWTEDEFRRRAIEDHGLLREITRRPLIMVAGEENEFRRAAGEPSHIQN